MIGLAYELLAVVVLLGGLTVLVLAFHDPLGAGPLHGMPDLRTPARWLYAAVAILTLVIDIGELPRSRRDIDLLWIAPISAVFSAAWPFVWANRVSGGGGLK